MNDPSRDRFAEALASGAAVLPTGEASEDEAVPAASPPPRSKAQTKRGRGTGAAARSDRFAYPKVLVRWKRHLTYTQFAVALALWNRQRVNRATGALVPFEVSHRTLGRDLGGVARNHVQEAVAVLERNGLAKVVIEGDRRKQTGHTYLMPEIPPEPPDKPEG